MKRRLLLLPVLAAAALTAALLLAPVSSQARGPGPCKGRDMVISAGEAPGGGAAGSVYYLIDFTNLGEASCTVTGYPNLSAVDLAGGRIGAFADKSPGKKPKVTLAPGDTASVTLNIVDALNYPKSVCKPVLAAGLKVHVPGGKGAKVAPLAFETCTLTSAKSLAVSPVTAAR